MNHPLLTAVRKQFRGNVDYKEKAFSIGSTEAVAVFMEALISGSDINDFVLKPLLTLPCFSEAKTEKTAKQYLEKGDVYALDQETVKTPEDSISALLRGCALIFLDGDTVAYAFEAQSNRIRQVAEPQSENVVKGGKESFVENVKINTATVRKRMRAPDLVAKDITIGRQSKTHGAIFYLENTVDPALVVQVTERLSGADVDMMDSIGTLEELLLGEDYNIFPGTVLSERPDRFCANLNEGLVGVIIDGFPYGIVTPACIVQHIHAPEDYAHHPIVSSLLRLLRITMIFVSLLLPAVYVSVMNFHQEMLPTQLAISIIRAKNEVPFNEFIETLIMLTAFEIIVEAGLRMPQTIGQAVSIVGGLIVGDAAINAKIISPFVVIVIAITVIASFTIPSQDFARAIKLYRFMLIVVGNWIGLAGVMLGMIFLLLHLSSHSVLGVPYLAPITSRSVVTKDTILRMPNRYNVRRPEYLRNRNPIRRKRT